ncbi:MAG: S1C family serine protease [Planctomycetota bacterium]|jgi:S1-C subfamily serine protease
MKIHSTILPAACLGLTLCWPTTAPAQITRGGGKYYEFDDRKPVTPMEKTIAKLLPSLVKVHGASGLKTIQSYATGVIVSDKGHILTLDLILIQENRTRVVLYDGTVCDAETLDPDERYGVRMLKIKDADLKKLDHPLAPLQPAKKQSHTNGTFVVSIGNCYRLAEFSEKISATFGVITARTKTGLRYFKQDVDYDDELIITDAPNNPGHYGGGLFTLAGEWIGVNAKIMESTQTNTQISAAIPTRDIARYIKLCLEGKSALAHEVKDKVIPVHHGIRLFDQGRRRSPPAYVDRVYRGSPGFKAGLRPDDLITHMDRVVIRTCNDFYARLRKYKPGDKVEITYKRGNKINMTDLTFAKKEKK